MGFPPRLALSGVLALASVLALVGCGRSTAPSPAAEPAFDNLVLVTIDTLRADHLGCYGYLRPTSPFIDSLARRGIRFARTIATSSHTAPSHASMFTSQYPARHRVLRNGNKLRPAVPTLSAMLSEEGFDTAAFVAMGFLKTVTHGFAKVDGVHGGPYRGADVMVDTALEWLGNRPQGRRVFLWVHMYDVHNSSRDGGIPEAQLDRMQQDSQQRGAELTSFLSERHGIPVETVEAEAVRYDHYDAQIAFVDENLKRLFDRWNAQHEGERTLWVITADHGEGLGNHDYFGHGKHLYREQLRVPLIFYGGDQWYAAGRVVDQMVRHVDLLPTLADLLGFSLDSEGMSLEGRSLVPLMQDPERPSGIRFAVAHRRPANEARRRAGWDAGLVQAAQTDRYKYILHSSGEDELYDLENDPFESTNLVGQGLEIEKEMAAWLIDKYESMRANPLVGTPEEPKIDEEFIEELRALGYLN